MASTSGCSLPRKEVETVSSMGASASEINHATIMTVGSCAGFESIVMTERNEDAIIEKEIERSKTHWSMLAEFDGEKVEPLRSRMKWLRFMLCCSNVDADAAKVSNVNEFLALQRHPSGGGFFQTFGYDLGELYTSMGKLVVGKRFAVGGQAEIYDCKVKWSDPKFNEKDKKDGRKYVLKVFKKGTYLKHFKSLLPLELLEFHAVHMKNFESPEPMKTPRFQCRILRGTLLKDGRFAFLMEKEQYDLRGLIDRNMELNGSIDCRPFSKEDAEEIIFRIALGVEWLHTQNIVHRDLKASNVLVNEVESWPKWECYVADFECSVGVVGTGFFRAPEILQACKDGELGVRPQVFSKAADIYGYGMICYEVLTGKFPIEGRLLNDYDCVLKGERPVVPEHVEDWIKGLLKSCWQLIATDRPCIGEILSLILADSHVAKTVDALLKVQFGKDYRCGYRDRV